MLTARSSERGRAAQEKLRRELTSAGVSGNVDEQLLFHQLDITDADSIQQFICWSKDSLGQVGGRGRGCGGVPPGAAHL